MISDKSTDTDPMVTMLLALWWWWLNWYRFYGTRTGLFARILDFRLTVTVRCTFHHNTRLTTTPSSCKAELVRRSSTPSRPSPTPLHSNRKWWSNWGFCCEGRPYWSSLRSMPYSTPAWTWALSLSRHVHPTYWKEAGWMLPRLSYWSAQPEAECWGCCR